MFNLALRNLRTFFRQKSAVFSSMLGVIILILMYAVFIGDSASLTGLDGGKQLMDSWLVAGIVAMTPFTSAVGALGTMVADKASGNLRDFYASPVKRSSIVGGYIISALVVGFLLSVLSFAVGEFYIVMRGGDVLSFFDMLKMLGAILLSTLISGTMGILIVCFINNLTAYTTVSIIIGSMTGFLTGMYVNIGALGEKVAWIVKLFPITHSTVLFRKILCADYVDSCFADDPALGTEFSKDMGIILDYNGYLMPVWMHCVIITGLSVLFFVIAVLKVSGEKRK